MTEKLSYNTEEAARALGISQEQVKKLIRAGELRAVRSKPMEKKPSGAFRGGKFLIPAESLRDYLASLEVA